MPLTKEKPAKTLFLDEKIPASLALEIGYRPSWLLREYTANTWVVKDTGNKPDLTIVFDVRFPNGKHLPDYPNLLDSIKRITYGVRSGPLMTVESGSVQQNIAFNLITLARWMTSNEIYRFEDLTRADAREYSELAAYGTNAILDTEGILHRHIEKLLMKSNFCPSDPPHERRSKACNAFPFHRNSRNTEMLDRETLLENAGLWESNSAGVLTQMLDELEVTCEFYQQPKTLHRMARQVPLDELDEKIVTTQQLRRLIMPFDYLYRHRRYLEDGLPHTLFPGSSPTKVAKALGKAAGRTGSVPVEQAAVFIERSVRWVVDYAPTLLALQEGKNVAAVLPEYSPCSPFPILDCKWRSVRYETFDEALQTEGLRQGMTLPMALNYLMTACAVVIAAFSARRASEILGLKAGCIERDDCGKLWMQIFIHKTTQGFTAIPVPEVVWSAISVLEQLSASARELNGSPFIFQYKLLDSDRCYGLGADGVPAFSFRSYLRKFGYFIDVPALPDGTHWTFRPHQFRRLFAILYIWIYELGDWGALSYHLRHFNLEATRRYGSDAELGHIVSVANREHTAHILAQAALGKIKVAGVEGTRFKEAAKRLHDRLTIKLQVVTEHKFTQRIMRLVERTGVILRALPWGYCAIRPGANKDACACASCGHTPDFGAATVSTCKDCVCAFRTPAFTPYLNSTLKLHGNIIQSTGTPKILREASEILHKELSEYIESVSTPEERAVGS